jgi:hypothetical protein
MRRVTHSSQLVFATFSSARPSRALPRLLYAVDVNGSKSRRVRPTAARISASVHPPHSGTSRTCYIVLQHAVVWCSMPCYGATCDDELEHAMACPTRRVLQSRFWTAAMWLQSLGAFPPALLVQVASYPLHGACGNKRAACHTRAYQATRVRGEGAKRDAAPRSARSAVCSERLDERRHDGPHLLRPARPIQGYTGGRPSRPCCLPGRWKPLAFGDDRMRLCLNR